MFLNGITFHCEVRQGPKLIKKQQNIRIKCSQFFDLCSLEDLVCSEIEEENTIEHCRLSQCDRTETHTEEATKVANIFVT
jgi:hypothetical protein